MVRFLVNRPVAVLTSFFALMLLGGAAFLRLPASLLPNVDIPSVSVRLKAPNYSAQEVENLLTAPMRSGLLQLHGLSHIESTSAEGSGTIQLVFEYGTNISMAFIEVNEKVDLAMNLLPKDAQRPLVSKASVGDIPVFRLNVFERTDSLSPARLAEISNFARQVIRRRIEQLPEVAMVDITGLSEPQIEISPKQGMLQAMGINEGAILQAFQEHNLHVGNILVRDGHYRYYLKFSSDINSLEEIGRTPLNVNGRLLRLSELTHIAYTNAEARGAYYKDGHRAINLAIIKQSASRMEDLKESFSGLLEQMEKDYPYLAFEVSQDQTQLLDYAVSNLQQDLLLGGILAFLLMLVFIRKLRTAILIGVTMPLSLLLSQLGFYLFGISINVISLGGLILGLGMIIDNSIVVMDTITRHRHAGQPIAAAAIRGTNEIIRPLITSVLTNCAVFIPLIFMSGLAGAIFYDQAVSITVGVASSLVVAILLLPPLYRLVYARQKDDEKEAKPLLPFTRWYELGLQWVFRFPALAVALVALLFVCGLWLYGTLPKQRLPSITRYDFEVTVDWNEQIGLDENEKRIKTLMAEVAPWCVETSAWIGEQQYLLPLLDDLAYTQSHLYIRTGKAQQVVEVQERLNAAVRHAFPLALARYTPAKNAFDEVFADRQAPLLLLLSDGGSRQLPPLERAEALADSLTRLLPHARINPVATHRKAVIKADAYKASLYGVGMNNLAQAVTSAFKSTYIADYQGAESLVPMVLTAAAPPSINEVLANTFVESSHKAAIPLAALVSVRWQQEYKYITAGVQGEYVPIAIHTDQAGNDLKRVQTHLEQQFGDLEVQIGGSYFENQELIGDMALILLVSVLLLYFILAAQFESLLQPLFILVELPIAVFGAFIALQLGGNSLNLMSMIGMVVMCGLIINDSILKIDAINQLRTQGVPLMEAIYEGGHKRLNAILMISFTSIGALLPTLFMHDLGSELQQPLALALMGGMFIGLFVSLFFVPLVYWMVYRKKDKTT